MSRRAAIGLLCAAWLSIAGALSAQAAGDLPDLQVVQNQFRDASGKQVHLMGVNRAGSEYACIQGWGIFDGPSDDHSVAAIAGWGANAVRLGLNEDCWLGINRSPEQYSGGAYRTAITDYVQRLHQHGLYAVLALMWAAPGTNQATWQEAMADEDHAYAFWSSVATTFRGDSRTLFDLYGEPSWISWTCWVDGCTYSDKYGDWRTAGMQKMVDTVRQAGAHNVILVSGADYANDLANWLAYAPKDPDHQLAAAFHEYGDNTCHDQACWDASIREVAMRVPVVTAELGETVGGSSCGHTFLDSYLAYAHSNGLSYLAWTWDTWNRCSTLIQDYDGTPTAFGAAVRDDLSSGHSFGSLPYDVSKPSRPLFEIQHERSFVLMVGALAVVLVTLIIFVGRTRTRRKGDAF
ncbi:MAG TPA: cellulase family glycosylhydrolase [Candidatus Dormibacteraeota bacterium]|nr:cellulase family glycosylhydrolase [Candidatus Dormibacteraeota bacterium]